ncbi:MAG TPA: DNA polymerase III subunit delta' [Pirellulales bacterium]|jgi:DNA polymerase-3 subunit delta'
MSWQGIEGHDDVLAKFRAMLVGGRLASTYLFVGPSGVGKRTFALRLAQTLLCPKRDPAEMNPCGVCDACLQVLAGTHPDLLRVAKPTDRSAIPVDLIIGPKERRMQEGLCHDISLKPFMGGRRVAIIEDADDLNEEGANALLKTLEEPPPRSVMILIGTSPDRQLPTIRSRSQLMRFRPLDAELIARLLLSQGTVSEPADAERIAAQCGGSLTQAVEMADPALTRFRHELVAQLADGTFDNVAFAKLLIALVEEAGKEAPPRRARMRQVITMAIQFYRELLRAMSGAPAVEESAVASVDRALTTGRFDPDNVSQMIERCLEALEHVDRNAHQAALLECWLDDLSQLAQA